MGLESVNSPAHYNSGKIEVIDFIEDQQLGFCLGNAIKYISRAGKKDKSKEVEDLKKALWYINRRIKELDKTEIVALKHATPFICKVKSKLRPQCSPSRMMCCKYGLKKIQNVRTAKIITKN